jgi:DNA-binding CsgD family transcriptional regulator
MLWATTAAWGSGDRSALLEIARQTAAIEPPAGDEAATFSFNFILGTAAMLRGAAADGVARLEEAVRWGAIAGDARYALFASNGSLLLGDDEAAAALARRSEQAARRRGEAGPLAAALGGRAAQLVMAQRFEEAAVAAQEAVRLAGELDAENLVLVPLGSLAIIAAIHGQDDQARRHGERVLELGTAKGLPQRAAIGAYALALADVGRGRWGEALDRFSALEEDGSGASDPIMAALMLPDKVEAAVRAGAPDTARVALSHYEAWAAHSGAPSAQPRVASCRALLADGDVATAHFEAALALGDQARPFDLARIRLLFGEHLRRERRRGDARTKLRAALETFDRFGAEPWAERARVELRATGETARRRDPSTVDQLTAQELQIARYVADGLSNKEVAAQLFLSPRTIDAHLRSVFAKLAITSRTQLARLPLGDGGDGDLTDATRGVPA